MDINITTPTATQVDALKRDGSNANSDVDLGAYALNANSFKINGTAGAGHIDLKHQSSDATSPASSTAIWANSSGDIKWKIDGNYKTTLATSQNTADRTYTFQNANGTLAFISDIPSLTPYLTIAAAAAAYQPLLGYTAENTSNKSSSYTLSSTTTYPNTKALVDGLATKITANTAITGSTKTKITYDANGLVTSGADATTADIADSTNKRYVTDAQLTVIGNTSGVNSGDQTITLTGDVTGSGTGSFAATIGANVVSNSKLATMAAYTIKANNTALSAAPQDIAISDLILMLRDPSRDFIYQSKYQNVLNFY